MHQRPRRCKRDHFSDLVAMLKPRPGSAASALPTRPRHQHLPLCQETGPLSAPLPTPKPCLSPPRFNDKAQHRLFKQYQLLEPSAPASHLSQNKGLPKVQSTHNEKQLHYADTGLKVLPGTSGDNKKGSFKSPLREIDMFVFI